jgi:hypothetical protein
MPGPGPSVALCDQRAGRGRDERDTPDTDRADNRERIGRMRRNVVALLGPVAA